MSEREFGAIPVEDYLRITDPPRRRRLRRWVALAAGLLVCLLCTAAGNLLRPFYGDPSKLTYEQAVAVLESTPPQQWVSEGGMYAAFRHVTNVLELLEQVAARSPRDAEYASIYLANVAHTVVEQLIRLRELGVLPETQIESLRVIRSGTNKDDD
ncbi:MAG: hypothetical protein KAI24_02990 [Planctomycetes bacterium]|nr:hypothetical protein [Planctomycetota bacterium]